MRATDIALPVLALLLAACGGASASPGASSSASGAPSSAEAQLLAGVRLDLQGSCVPVRTGLDATALAAVECTPPGGEVSRVRLVLYDADAALGDAYLARIAAIPVEPRTPGECAPGQPSEDSYIPGDTTGVLNADRQACWVDSAGVTHALVTMPPFVLGELVGASLAGRDVQWYAFRGNVDTPGGPTLWNAAGPMSPEK